MPPIDHILFGTQWDFSLLVILTLGLHVLVYRLVLTRLLSRFSRGVSFAVVLLFLLSAWFVIQRSGEREKERVESSMEGVAPTYALEIERMGHAELQPGVATTDRRYQMILEAERRWLRANPAVRDIYTFRSLPNGETVYVVALGADNGSDAMGAHRATAPRNIGEPFNVDKVLLSRVQLGASAMSANDIGTIKADSKVEAYYPLHDASGRLEAYLGVDFDAAQLLQAISRARFAATSYLAAFVLAMAMSAAALGAWSLERENRQHARTAAAMEESQRKLQDIINSIDGVVWEWDTEEETYVFVSNHAIKLLGEPEQRWITDNLFWRARILHEDSDRVLTQRKNAALQDAPYQCEYRMITPDGRTIWVRERASRVCDKGRHILLRGVMSDVTLEKIADSDLEDLNKQLVETSRRAGMAEVASGVLHNVGNVLNSVNVSCTVIGEVFRQSKLTTLGRVADLLEEQSADLAGFFAKDPRAGMVPRFIRELSNELLQEQKSAQSELQALVKNVAHIKHIVVMQQSYASVGGLTETLDPAVIIEDAIRLHETAFTRNGITIVKDFDKVPSVQGDRNRVLQILVNLVRNATHALSDAKRPDKQLKLGLHANGNQRVKISVIDNGAGIAPENLPRMFSYGFTTKRDGHGFGLHSGAAAAREMGGSLTVKSEGVGKGAAFFLELPFAAAPTTYTPGLS